MKMMTISDGTPRNGWSRRARRLYQAILALMLVLFGPQPAAAQQREPDATLESIVITGTRRPDRTVTESLSPIDVVTSQDLETQGYVEVDDLLRTTVPSYQVGSHPIDDAGTLVRPAKLRGLAPDQTLVLVNGQRRHRSAGYCQVSVPRASRYSGSWSQLESGGNRDCIPNEERTTS